MKHLETTHIDALYDNELLNELTFDFGIQGGLIEFKKSFNHESVKSEARINNEAYEALRVLKGKNAARLFVNHLIDFEPMTESEYDEYLMLQEGGY